jgi:hypothetical protein
VLRQPVPASERFSPQLTTSSSLAAWCSSHSYDLIELRFLPSRRRRRDPEYFAQLKSMTMPREVNYRVSREERRAALLALAASA